MSLWEVKSSPSTKHDFQQVVPRDVLDSLDGPLTFTFENRGRLYLANLCAIGEGVSRYVVSPTNDYAVLDLKQGMLTLHAALIRPTMWLVDVARDGQVISVWNVVESDLPAESIPDQSALLTSEIEAAIKADERLSRFLESGSDGRVALDGGPVKGHEVEAGFYGRFWEKFQSLVDATAQAMFGGSGPKLWLGMTSPSSYAVDVRIPEDEDIFAELFGTKQAESQVRTVFDRVASMMYEGDQPRETVDIINLNQSVRREYGSVLQLLSQRSASVFFQTRSHPRGRGLSSSAAADRLKSVQELGWPYGRVTITGKLILGSVEKVGASDPTFDIRVGEKTHFKGKVAVEAIESIEKVHLGDDVIAKLQVHDDEGKPQTYTLLGIDRIAKPESDAN